MPEDEPKPEGFGPTFRRLREKTSVTRSDLDQLLKEEHKLSTGYTALLESGRIKPPEEEVCTTLATAIGMDPVELWGMAADERLERLDPKLAKWFRDKHEAALERQRKEFDRLLAEVEQLNREGQARSGHLGSLWKRIGWIQSCLDDPTVDVVRILDQYLKCVSSMAEHEGGQGAKTEPQWREGVGAALRTLLLPLLEVPIQLPPALGVHAFRTTAQSNASLQAAWVEATKLAPRWAATWTGDMPLDAPSDEPEPPKPTRARKAKSTGGDEP